MKPKEFNGIEFFMEEPESYIQINDINEEDLDTLWQYLQSQYPGFQVDLCFRNVPTPTKALDKIGATVIDDCVEMRMDLEGNIAEDLAKDIQVNLLTQEEFPEFAKLHDSTYPTMYWTSKRILESWDIWRIFTIRGDGKETATPKITGYILYKHVAHRGIREVFCVAGGSLDQHKALLSAIVKWSQTEGMKAEQAHSPSDKTILFMIDRNDNFDMEMEAAGATGFKETGFYVGYSTNLSTGI